MGENGKGDARSHTTNFIPYAPCVYIAELVHFNQFPIKILYHSTSQMRKIPLMMLFDSSDLSARQTIRCIVSLMFASVFILNRWRKWAQSHILHLRTPTRIRVPELMGRNAGIRVHYTNRWSARPPKIYKVVYEISCHAAFVRHPRSFFFWLNIVVGFFVIYFNKKWRWQRDRIDPMTTETSNFMIICENLCSKFSCPLIGVYMRFALCILCAVGRFGFWTPISPQIENRDEKLKCNECNGSTKLYMRSHCRIDHKQNRAN